MASLSRNKLEGKTRKYWRKESNVDSYEWYIKNLLGDELQYADQNPTPEGFPRLQKPVKPVHTLALTVGDSFEPLLQLICVLKPQRVVLILNAVYPDRNSGNSHGATLRRLIAGLATQEALPDEFRPALREADVACEVIDADTPTAVFRGLRESFSPSQTPAEAGRTPGSDSYTNVVDITGAKKSMVAGAFLYAAHSGLPVTYVDFDANAYDRTYHRPYGFLCRIGEIANPYNAYRLRDWERVRQLYERYDFRGALEIIGRKPESGQPGQGILGAMGSPVEAGNRDRPLYDEDDIRRVEELVAILTLYEAWDSGDLERASQANTRLPNEKTPEAVRKLGSDWPSISPATLQSPSTYLYGDERKLKVYAADEYARIRRLIVHNQDYHSAFLRAGGLNETLMAARLVREFAPADRQKVVEALEVVHTPKASELFGWMAAGESLSVKSIFSPKKLRGQGRPDLAAWADQSTITFNPMVEWWQKPDYSPAGNAFGALAGWDNFRKVRNALAHRYSAVSQELAEDALRFVGANIEDFFGQPQEAMDVNTPALPWDSLCDLCQLDFLPPRLRTHEPFRETEE